MYSIYVPLLVRMCWVAGAPEGEVGCALCGSGSE